MFLPITCHYYNAIQIEKLNKLIKARRDKPLQLLAALS